MIPSWARLINYS